MFLIVRCSFPTNSMSMACLNECVKIHCNNMQFRENIDIALIETIVNIS